MASTSSNRQRDSRLLQEQQKTSCIHTLQRSRHLWPLINVLGLITWIFSMAGTVHCSFIMIEQLNEPFATPLSSANGSATEDSVVEHPVGLGLFSTSVYDMEANLLGCVSYYGTSDEFDGAFRAARSFGMIAAFSTSIALICVTLVTLFVESVPHKVNLWSVARFLFFAAFLCELLTFLAFGRDLCSRSDMECRPGAASILTILNLFLLCILSALIYVVPPVTAPLFLLRKERPLGGTPDSQEAANFEILSVHPSKASLRQQQKGPVDVDDLAGIDLESECGTQTPSMIMEGIECVAADHLRRDETSFLDKMFKKYFEIGRKKSTRITIAVLLCKAWVCTIVGITRCTFILVGATGQDRTEFSGLGLFNRAYYMNDDILGCIAYPSAAKSEFDAAFEVGRAFGMLTLLLMTAALVSFIVLHGFVESSQHKEMAWLCLTQVTLPCAFICQLVTFSAFETQSCTQSNNVDCVPGVGAIFSILNVLLLFPLATFIFALPCPKRSIFRMRISSRPRQPPAAPTIKSQVKQYKENRKQQKKQKNQEQQQNREEGQGPEPSSTHSVSEHSNDGQPRVRSFAPDPPAQVDESIEVCNSTTVENKDGSRTTTKEIRHPDGSITITTTVEQYEPIVPKSVSSNPSSSSSQGFAMEPTLTSGVPPSTSGGPTITLTSSWDSRASVEQFETVDMDTSNNSSQQGNVIERNMRAALKKPSREPESVGNGKCCMVEATAMSIMREMQEEDERTRLQQLQASQPKRSSSRRPTYIPHVDDMPTATNYSSLSSSSNPTETVTTRGGRLNPSTTTVSSSDAIGDPTITSSSDTYSKISSTEYCFGSDDGKTYNTGDAINNDASVAAQKRPVKVFV